MAAVRSAAADGELKPDEGVLEVWSAWALAHADELDPVRAGTALGTELLWEEEDERDALSRGRYRYPPPPPGDPNWFWGKRWWARS